MADDTLKAARSIALEVFHNCVDSDDGSHCLDTAVAADIIADAISSALSAERAALAEARKALEEIGNGCDGRIDKDALPCRIARRALTGGREDG